MKLGEAVTLRKGNTIEIQDAETYRISGIQNYGKGVVVRREVKGAELTMRQYQVIEANQLMWCKVDTKNGAFGVTHDEHVGTLASPNMALADINLAIAEPVFLETLFRIQSFADYITNLSTGTTNRKYLTPTELLKQVTLPDWDTKQQRTFVEKLQNIENCGLSREITHQETLLAKLKQAILQEAIEGKLTAAWRAAHPDTEPASSLLRRIQAEKARLIAAKKLRPEKHLPPIADSEIPFAIPENWAWCRLGQSGILKRGKSKHRPRNDERLFEAGAVPFVQTGDVSQSKHTGFLIQTCSGHYNDFGVTQSQLWPVGTMCITIAANIAETGFLTVPACVPDSVVTFSSPVGEDSPKYARMFIELTRIMIEKFAPATAQKNINLEILNELMLPLPPLAEQAEIVAQVESLMAGCQALETEIAQARAHAAHLLQAVLREAFAPAAASTPAEQASPAAQPIPIPAPSAIPPSTPRKQLNQHFARAVLSAEIVHQLHAEPTFGRVKHQKIFHLCEHIARIEEIAGQYHREAAGPLDNRLIYANEGEIKRQQWYLETPRETHGHAYIPLAKAGAHEKYLTSFAEEQVGVIRRLIDLMRKWDTDRCEIFCTAYAAWNDLILWRREPTEDAILHEILERWNPAKRRFPRERWKAALKWMREQNFTPTGYGSPTAKA